MPASLSECAALYNAGRFADARDMASQLLEAEPNNTKARSLWAAASAEAGDVAMALSSIRKVLASGADHPLIHNLAARVFITAGELEEAETALRRVLEGSPADSGALQSLAEVLVSLGNYTEALNAYDSLAELGNAQVAVQRAALHWQLGAYDQAAELLEQHLENNPNDPHAMNQLGLVRKSQLRYAEALALFDQAIETKPKFESAYANLAVTYQEFGHPDKGLEALERLDIQPPKARFELLKALMLPVILESTDSIAEWRSRFGKGLDRAAACANGLADPFSEVGLNHFHLAYQALNDRALQRKAAAVYLSLCPSLSFQAPRLAKWSIKRKIRIAFVSSNLRSHTVGYLNAGFLTHFDRTRFEVTLVSPSHGQDQMYQEMVAAADHVLTVQSDLGQARKLVADGQFDIVYYPDIGMHAFTYYLAFARLAPVQAVGWGHPVTTGIPNVDYFVSCDAMEPADAEEHYTETLVRLPDVGGHYQRPTEPKGSFDFAAHGLPQDVPLLTCPQSCFKFHPGFDPLLRRILEQVPEARLVLLTSVPSTNSELLHKRLKQNLGAAASRVHFVGPLSHEDFLRLLRSADAVLDIPHWSGGRSGYEALAMGAPIVHLPGRFMRGRHTGAFYKVMGVNDCVVEDEDAYVDLAVRLLTDDAYTAGVKKRIADNSESLFSRMEAVHALEDFFVQAVEKASAKP